MKKTINRLFGAQKKNRFGREPRKDGLLAGVADKKKPQVSLLHKVKFATIATVFLLLTTYLFLPDIIFFTQEMSIGEISPKAIFSPMDIDIQDRAATERLKEKVGNEQPAIFDFDRQYIKKTGLKISKAFRGFRAYLKDREEQDAGVRGATGSFDNSEAGMMASLAEQEKQFQIELGVPLSKQTLKLLLDEGYSLEIERAVKNVMSRTLEIGVIADVEMVQKGSYRGVILKGVGDSTEVFIEDVQLVMGRVAANTAIKLNLDKIFSGSKAKSNAAHELIRLLITPNITFNKSETESFKRRAVDSVKTLYFHVEKGEVIVPAGGVVDAESVLVLREIYKYTDQSFLTQILLGVFLVVFIMLYVFYVDIRRYKPALLDNIPQFSLLVILFAGTILISRFTYFLLRSFVTTFPVVEQGSIIYALPLAVGAMLVVILVDIHTAIVFSFIISLLMGVFVHGNSLYVFYTFVGSIVAVFSVRDCKRRTGLLKAGLFVGFANIALLIAINLYNVRLFTIPGMLDLAFGFGGGVIVALIGSFLLPLCEFCFDVTTDIKLLELSDLNQPLLRNLLISAPGTYHHSMMVGTLAEEAAESIGENPLLARVSCYYHDIGKIVKPEYYIENQLGTLNRHDKLSPKISSIIVISHVKEGIEIGTRAKLPREVLAIISEHHGTRVIKFFYEKAKSSMSPSDVSIPEEEYRYQGPKPRSKNSAIIMMADALEACSRVLSDPSPARITTLVENVVADIYTEKQFDESDLTTTDLNRLKESFIKTLIGIFHRRIDYPGVKYYEEEEVEDGGMDREQDGKGKHKPETPGGSRHRGVVNIKRT